MKSMDTSLFEDALKRKNPEMANHAYRVAKLALRVGRKIGLSDEVLKELHALAILHDIGKIEMSDDILVKTGKLTADEWEEITRHSETGYHIALEYTGFSDIAECILSHHERWDGKGYPRGLKSDEIPELSRLISVADAYDAMTSQRPYNVPKSHKEALEEIKECSGTQFDPNVVSLFLEVAGSKGIVSDKATWDGILSHAK